MGGWLSYIWWGGDPDEENKTSGLSRRDIYAVQKSWAPVYANTVPNGTELLKRFFRAYPETKEYFRMIKNIPEEQFASNTQFKAHVINLMSSLNMAINNLDQPEVVIVMMNKLGDSHGKRKIKQGDFNNLKVVLVAMFIDVLNLNDSTLGSWGKTVDFWYKHLFQTLNQSESR